jgi:hypothetical protein
MMNGTFRNEVETLQNDEVEHSEILKCYNDEMGYLGKSPKCYNNKMRCLEIWHKCYNYEMELSGVNLQPMTVLNFPSQNSGCDAAGTQLSISSPVTES